MKESKIKGLILFVNEQTMSYLNDWLDAFNENEFFKLDLIDIDRIERNTFKQLIRKLDKENIIILHHSVLRTVNNINKFKYFIPILSNRKCKVISFIGDEINLHNCSLSEKIDALKVVNPDLIATQLLKEAANFLYGDLQVKIIEMPHALNEKIFKSYIPYEERKYDISTISVTYPIYLGDNDREKIFNFFISNKDKLNLRLNLIKGDDVGKRLNRLEWVDFLNNTKATISSEAGSFYLEKDNKTIRKIVEYLKEKEKIYIIDNNSFLKKIYNLLPIKGETKIKIKNSFKEKLKNIKSDTDILFDNAYFEEVYEIFYKNRCHSICYGKAISSRHFDAIGTKTIQILIEGRYNDILKPYEHYIPVKRDLSNIEEAILLFKDTDYVKKVTENVYDLVVEKHTYKHRIEKLYNLLSQEL